MHLPEALEAMDSVNQNDWGGPLHNVAQHIWGVNM